MTVRLNPGAGRDSIDGVEEGVLRARVRARPVDDAANAALRRLIAAELHVAPSRVAIVAGQTRRLKVVAIDGVTVEAVRSRWPSIAV